MRTYRIEYPNGERGTRQTNNRKLAEAIAEANGARVIAGENTTNPKEQARLAKLERIVYRPAVARKEVA